MPALAATFAASFGFMLPVSTPQNAIVYGSGCVPITRMLRSGISFDILGGVLIVLCCRSRPHGQASDDMAAAPAAFLPLRLTA
ncbi:anion permease [Microbacterium foliorum]|uniref:anion permease n=1 Tax=Microbacterium foliorum TaxID=104336 RepID=UPI0037355D74